MKPGDHCDSYDEIKDYNKDLWGFIKLFTCDGWWDC